MSKPSTCELTVGCEECLAYVAYDVLMGDLSINEGRLANMAKSIAEFNTENGDLDICPRVARLEGFGRELMERARDAVFSVTIFRETGLEKESEIVNDLLSSFIDEALANGKNFSTVDLGETTTEIRVASADRAVYPEVFLDSFNTKIFDALSMAGVVDVLRSEWSGFALK